MTALHEADMLRQFPMGSSVCALADLPVDHVEVEGPGGSIIGALAAGGDGLTVRAEGAGEALGEVVWAAALAVPRPGIVDKVHLAFTGDPALVKVVLAEA